jgi:L-threonylcarbamoyladenylate synthase
MNTPIITPDEAIEFLNQGKVGVMPTDTVYGLVARAQDPVAVARLYQLKNRDHKPGTVIAANTDQLLALGISPTHIDKVKHLWPNPVSIETPLGPELSYLHQNTGRQGFRVVADENIRTILEQTGPLVTSSANRPGAPGSVTIQEAISYFEDRIDFYIDGGDLSGRPPSTIIKLEDDGSLSVIRQGAITIK